MKNKPKVVKIDKKKIKQVNNANNRHAYFSNYFFLEVANDDVTFGFGQKIPGIMEDDSPVNEVMNRVIMTKTGAKVFYDLLKSVIEEEDTK